MLTYKLFINRYAGGLLELKLCATELQPSSELTEFSWHSYNTDYRLII